MLMDGLDAASAAFEVGYESASQFNREYRRSSANRRYGIFGLFEDQAPAWRKSRIRFSSAIMVPGAYAMRRFITVVMMLALALALSAAAQDWYREREERFGGEQWRRHIFLHVRSDLGHVWSGRASDKERKRLRRTEEELTKMQADLEHGRFDNGILNDVIDSIRKSSNDERLPPRDRAVLADDLIRLKDYQDHHDHWR